jgi:hypothetical protein
MLTIRQGIMLSAIIDKMDLKVTNPKGTQAEVGADLTMQFVRGIHRAGDEIYAFVADVRKISPEEAAETNLIEFLKELVAGQPDISHFFASAVKSAGLE